MIEFRKMMSSLAVVPSSFLFFALFFQPFVFTLLTKTDELYHSSVGSQTLNTGFTIEQVQRMNS